MKKLGLLFAFAMLLPTPGFAYVGPGLGLNAIGMVLGLLFAIFMLVLGTVWYPLKKAWKSFRKKFGSLTESEKTDDAGPLNP